MSWPAKIKKADIPDQIPTTELQVVKKYRLGEMRLPVDQEDARRRHEEAIRRCVQHQEGKWDAGVTSRFYSGELITWEEFMTKAKAMGYQPVLVQESPPEWG